MPAEQHKSETAQERFIREHRLYQVDFLLRKYGFKETDIVFENNGNLSLQIDPKESWAINHPERFPVNVNKASKYELLRVPGFGLVTVNRILQMRKSGRLRKIEDVGRTSLRLEKAKKYLTF